MSTRICEFSLRVNYLSHFRYGTLSPLSHINKMMHEAGTITNIFQVNLQQLYENLYPLNIKIIFKFWSLCDTVQTYIISYR